MIHVYNNVNIKGERYEIKGIIEDFLEQNKNGESRMFNVDRISSNGDKYPCKLCYESTIKEDDLFERLNGIAFCFGGIKPYYVNYCGVLANRNSLIINSSSFVIIRTSLILSIAVKAAYKTLESFPPVNAMKVLSELFKMLFKDCDISSAARCK